MENVEMSVKTPFCFNMPCGSCKETEVPANVSRHSGNSLWTLFTTYCQQSQLSEIQAFSLAQNIGGLVVQLQVNSWLSRMMVIVQLLLYFIKSIYLAFIFFFPHLLYIYNLQIHRKSYNHLLQNCGTSDNFKIKLWKTLYLWQQRFKHIKEKGFIFMNTQKLDLTLSLIRKILTLEQILITVPAKDGGGKKNVVSLTSPTGFHSGHYHNALWGPVMMSGSEDEGSPRSCLSISIPLLAIRQSARFKHGCRRFALQKQGRVHFS